MAFNTGFYAYAIIGHKQADQLLPQLLMEKFDTFPKHCRCIEHMLEGDWFRKNKFSRCPSVRPCVRPSVTFCFLNILNRHENVLD